MASAVKAWGSRQLPKVRRVAVDLLVLSAAYWGAFLLRFDGEPPLQMWKLLAFTWPYVVGLEFAVLYSLAVTRFAWRYVGLREAVRTLSAIAVASALLLAFRLGFAWVRPHWGHAIYGMVPIGIIAANALLAFSGLMGTRVARRLVSERGELDLPEPVEKVPTLLIGAGRAGVLVAREIAAHRRLPFETIGFVDDDTTKRGCTIHGIPVLGTQSDLSQIVRETGARQAIITMTNAQGGTVRDLCERCTRAGVEVKVIPGLYQILDGQVNLSRLRRVSIEDLLGREPVVVDEDALTSFLRGKRVLVTGAGGSIGSELCRQLSRFEPALLVLLDRAEAGLFEIHRQLVRSVPGLVAIPCVGDVSDAGRIEALFLEHRPDVVIHAAAHKHVPLMEHNPAEAVKNNVGGTRTIADAAERWGAEAFVLISTDKAVKPVSVMGATKRVAEMYVQARSQHSTTKFIAVRFGNVLGSTGSVVPIFEAQIAEGGPVTVTHPDMVRYFMTVSEATQLVLQAAALGKTGRILVLDMGKPVRILELAEQLIRLSGLEPGRDIRIEFTGARPGEKLVEELAMDVEGFEITPHPKIFVGTLGSVEIGEMEAAIEMLLTTARSGDEASVVRALHGVVPEMLSAVQVASCGSASATGSAGVLAGRPRPLPA